MIVLDDLLVRPFVSILDAIHTLALTELYDIDEIQGELKENRLLYELGERSGEEYTRRREELKEELEVAKQVREQLQHKQIEVHK